jgi:hypothetical protein
MGPSRYGARNRLSIDAAEIGHSKSLLIEFLSKLMKTNARLHSDEPTFSVYREYLVEIIQIDHPA